MSSKSYSELSDYEKGVGVNFERIRRITGYLVGTLERFNSGKKAEEHDRVKHNVEEANSFEFRMAK